MRKWLRERWRSLALWFKALRRWEIKQPGKGRTFYRKRWPLPNAPKARAIAKVQWSAKILKADGSVVDLGVIKERKA